MRGDLQKGCMSECYGLEKDRTWELTEIAFIKGILRFGAESLERLTPC